MSKSASRGNIPPHHEWTLREASNQDAEDIIRLIDSVYREYGDRVCLEDADHDLLSLESSYRDREGRFVVMISQGRIIGTHAILPLPDHPSHCTFRRLYLDPAWRGREAGRALMNWALDSAKEMGFERVEFWSDTRFTRAHQFFKRFGFAQDGRVREMLDGHEPYREYFFAKSL